MTGKRKSKQSARWLIYYATVALVYGLLSCTPALATDLSIYKTVDNSVPGVGDIVTFTIVVQNLSTDVESAGTLLTDDLSQFENVEYRWRKYYWVSGIFFYQYVTGSFSSWANWTGSFTLGSLDRWRDPWILGNPAGGKYEIEIRATVPQSLSGREFTNTAEIVKDGFKKSASTSIMVYGEPWSVSEIFTPFYKPVPPLFENNIQPNVLLLIDTSGSMTFNMFDDNSTNGDGSGPVTYGFSGPQFYYGRDTDDSNNDPGGEHNYHPGMKYILESNIELIVDEQGSVALDWLGHTNISPPVGGYSNYLHPNDSRMYQTKLVLNEIFSDQQLISGLRVALATYDQNYTSSGALADWYYFRYFNSTERQYLHYETGSARAKLREGFGSTDNPSHLAGLVRWFDGVEDDGNPELRAQGGTPLAASIYGVNPNGKWNSNNESAVKFFKARNVIQAWCQDNWLIVLTDGANTDVGDPVKAVYKLYHETEENNWPHFFNKPARPIRTLVIGLIDPDEMDELAETLNEMADIGWDGKTGDDADNPGPGAFFAKDIDELLSAFRTIFKIIQASQTTGGAPMVSPSRTEAGESSVYVASFLPQNYTQWKGHLRRYEISSDGELDDTPEWDAAEKLAGTLEGGGLSARQVCTVDWAGSVASKTTSLGSHTNFVDFDEGNASALTEEMFPEEYTVPSLFVSKFINWFRGKDEWNEDPTSLYRYAFPDIYHGGVTEVGPPVASYPSETYASFKADNSDRDKVLYLQSNAGLLHAINLNDAAGEDPGGEKWAFIPPNALARGRLLGLKAYYSNDGTVDLLDETPSVPRYLLDGPLVAEDVVMSEGWCTVLLGCLGYGGHGMYALDVTDPDEPRFLWAVENNVISPDGSLVLGTDSRKIHYWKKESGLQVDYQTYTHEEMNDDNELDYRQLYRTLSTPLVAYTRSVTEDDGSWEGRWIAAMGNGHPGDFTDTFNEGFVYMIDIENGEILRKLEALDGGENVLKPVAAPVSGFSSSIATRILDHLYAADIEGDVYNWSASREQWEEALQIFDAPEDEAGVTYRMDVGMINGNPWLFYQTGDMENLNHAETVFRIYALNTTEAIEGYPLKIDDLQELTPTGSATSTGYEGWYMNFEDDPLEIPSTPATFYNGYLLFATFVESDDPCEMGDSKIYLVNARTGEGTWKNGKRFVQLSGLQITGITIFDDRVYLGVVGMATQQDLPDALGQYAMLAQNLLSFKLPEEVPSSEDGGGGTNPGLIFWKEWRDRQ